MLNSPIEIAMVFGVALLVFGPKKLPELGRSLGLGIGNFKKSLQEAQEEVKSAMRTDAASATPPATEAGASLQPANRATETATPGTCCGGEKHNH